ncbi:hypothetical protein [Kibdelosporangium phytohabitans]|uniref:Uncharacterized protein n=1 Tax=Kibdelosporangium phytohabitans TaxID=860235 RepID=A0A0N9HUV3_9PSEU|nr:hypothetical protein [Kibdelosporangium phytohabitans]ALG07252.1 hypothetical protein AOZ06_10260 [Kibdelosporangium phytohabitans]MBE1471889.1 hypothetical protein [Kibdelosporangium phytohabitans]
MPEPILVAISAALAAKAVTSIYDFVRTKFATRKEAAAALDAAQGAAPESPEVKALAAELEKAEAADPEFGEQLRTQWQAAQQAGTRTGNMSISGTMENTKFVQAQNINGDINF